MDNEIYSRIETLEDICRQTLNTVNSLNETVNNLQGDFVEFREEQREQSNQILASLKQVIARVGAVEGRISAIELRISAVEAVIFDGENTSFPYSDIDKQGDHLTVFGKDINETAGRNE